MDYAMKTRLFLQSVLKQLPKEAVKYLKCFVAWHIQREKNALPFFSSYYGEWWPAGPSSILITLWVQTKKWLLPKKWCHFVSGITLCRIKTGTWESRWWNIFSFLSISICYWVMCLRPRSERVGSPDLLPRYQGALSHYSLRDFCSRMWVLSLFMGPTTVLPAARVHFCFPWIHWMPAKNHWNLRTPSTCMDCFAKEGV